MNTDLILFNILALFSSVMSHESIEKVVQNKTESPPKFFQTIKQKSGSVTQVITYPKKITYIVDVKRSKKFQRKKSKSKKRQKLTKSIKRLNKKLGNFKGLPSKYKY